jgi:putative MATE family efflux protein
LAVALEQPKTIDLRIERLNQTIVELALPSVLESVLTTMVYLMDTILIAHLDDPVALAAVGLSSTLMWAADGLFQAISVSASAMVARFWGQRDFEAARRIAGQALILSVLVALLLMSLLIPIARPFLRLMDAETAVVESGAQYLHILLATSVISFPLSVANSIMRAAGDTRRPMYITALMNVCNVGAAYVLIFGLWGIPILGGIPGMGVRGAALATSLARTLGGGIAVGILFSDKAPIRLRFAHRSHLGAQHWRDAHLASGFHTL